MGNHCQPGRRGCRHRDPRLLMKIAVLREGAAGERRVAAVPETVKKFIGLGATMAVETGAGSKASVSDAEYETAGASVADRESVLKDADIILGVQGPDPASLAGWKPGAWLVAALKPFGDSVRVAAHAVSGNEAHERRRSSAT